MRYIMSASHQRLWLVTVRVRKNLGHNCCTSHIVLNQWLRGRSFLYHRIVWSNQLCNSAKEASLLQLPPVSPPLPPPFFLSYVAQVCLKHDLPASPLFLSVGITCLCHHSWLSVVTLWKMCSGNGLCAHSTFLYWQMASSSSAEMVALGWQIVCEILTRPSV